MSRLGLTLAIAVMALTAGSLQAEPRRDYLIMVGSTTIYPFSAMVIERFVADARFKPPMVQTLGSGGGLMLFCHGTGDLDPDIAYSSRPIRRSEMDRCRENEVVDFAEIKIGYDGIVLAQSRKATPLNPSRQDIFLALAKFLPDPDEAGAFMENPHQTWSDVNEALPAIPIEVWGPGRGSGTRFSFRRLAMEEGCRTLDGMIELEQEDPWRYREVCRDIRADGVYVEVGENDQKTMDSLAGNTHAIALLSFAFVETHENAMRGLEIDGIAPEVASIANGSYLLARPLYMYVKKDSIDVYPGLREFLNEFMSEDAFGPGGYLASKGLVPMDAEERQKYAEIARNLTPMSM